MIKKILIAILAIFIIIQFIRPKKNIASGPFPNSINQNHAIPEDVQAILTRSCYDCHSNNTHYPWYNNIQPVAWLLAHDINEGKKHFNFDEFNTYSISRRQRKLAELIDEIKMDEMPMGIYTVLHRNAVLSKAEKQKLINWADNVKNAIR
ncbi:heme-binding domain-containing protein [Chitinophaga sancti]|uniref:heme-binding domain-containing protein n=1 Tax=Chitinophaga sancti TaxID=1004 RepID=UPI002A75ADCF|nr:heme-binding domain-containing protein [Chitinophaga sancti]WPQ61448.1 heme-binding domain-containing protein [Chitinophaga sancti]